MGKPSGQPLAWGSPTAVSYDRRYHRLDQLALPRRSSSSAELGRLLKKKSFHMCIHGSTLPSFSSSTLQLNHPQCQASPHCQFLWSAAQREVIIYLFQPSKPSLSVMQKPQHCSHSPSLSICPYKQITKSSRSTLGSLPFLPFHATLLGDISL